MGRAEGKCPQCGEPADPSSNNPARPFCSRRCKLIDLGDWIDERHSIPGDDSQPWTNGSNDGVPPQSDHDPDDDFDRG